MRTRIPFIIPCATHPVLWADSLAGWLVTRYDDVAAALRNPKLSNTARNVLMRRKIKDPQLLAVIESQSNNVIFSDPPAQTRMRGLVNKAFTPKRVEAMAGRIQNLVDEFLNAVQDRGGMDVIADLAYPLPVVVIASMMGVPVEDRDSFKDWCDKLAVLVNAAGGLTEEQVRTALAAREEFTHYLRGLVKQRRGQRKDDLLSALVQAEEAGDHLSEAEMYSNAMLIIGAGHETTTNLIGNGLLALLRNPDQLQKLRDNPALLPNAVEEMLRYDSPVQLMARLALDDLVLHGEQIRKGQIVFLIFGAANRDPAVFSEPDRFDITRRDIKHLSFGAGIHFCLGASLARLEGQIALGSLIRHFPRLQLASKELHFRDNFPLHGVKALPVQF